jgi:hypothetical protein
MKTTRERRVNDPRASGRVSLSADAECADVEGWRSSDLDAAGRVSSRWMDCGAIEPAVASSQWARPTIAVRGESRDRPVVEFAHVPPAYRCTMHVRISLLHFPAADASLTFDHEMALSVEFHTRARERCEFDREGIAWEGEHLHQER